MSPPILEWRPRTRKQWILTAVGLVLVGAFIAGMVVGSVEHGKKKENMPQEWRSICDVETQSLDDARRQYEEMKVRQKERCDERIEKWNKEREVLLERVEVCPCCPGGCDEELVYKDYLLQSQATYYKKHLKKACGVKRPPDPDEKELVKFMKEIEEEEEEVF